MGFLECQNDYRRHHNHDRENLPFRMKRSILELRRGEQNESSISQYFREGFLYRSHKICLCIQCSVIIETHCHGQPSVLRHNTRTINNWSRFGVNTRFEIQSFAVNSRTRSFPVLDSTIRFTRILHLGYSLGIWIWNYYRF